MPNRFRVVLFSQVKIAHPKLRIGEILGIVQQLLQHFPHFRRLLRSRIVPGQLHNVGGSLRIISHLKFRDVLGVGATVGVGVENVQSVVNRTVSLLSWDQFQGCFFRFRVAASFLTRVPTNAVRSRVRSRASLAEPCGSNPTPPQASGLHAPSILLGASLSKELGSFARRAEADC